MKQHAFDEVLTPLLAFKWQELPPAEQRALFSQLTKLLLAMMEQDQLPADQVRITNADRARRTGENKDKLALIRIAYETIFFEMLSEDEYNTLLTFLKTAAHTLDNNPPYPGPTG